MVVLNTRIFKNTYTFHLPIATQFYLEDVLAATSDHLAVLNAVKTYYPREMLPLEPSEFYVVVGDRIIEGSGALKLGSLERFVIDTESLRIKARIVAFGRSDEQNLLRITERRKGWGDNVEVCDGRYFKVYRYVPPPPPAPPNQK